MIKKNRMLVFEGLLPKHIGNYVGFTKEIKFYVVFMPNRPFSGGL
jgi:hypothetical protein